MVSAELACKVIREVLIYSFAGTRFCHTQTFRFGIDAPTKLMQMDKISLTVRTIVKRAHRFQESTKHGNLPLLCCTPNLGAELE